MNYCNSKISTVYKKGKFQIQSVVREVASERGVGQVPVTICTFTNERKLYLSPGVNMRKTHPEELTDPVLPNPPKSELNFLGKVMHRCDIVLKAASGPKSSANLEYELIFPCKAKNKCKNEKVYTLLHVSIKISAFLGKSILI